jgi:hypothetical protein
MNKVLSIKVDSRWCARVCLRAFVGTRVCVAKIMSSTSEAMSMQGSPLVHLCVCVCVCVCVRVGGNCWAHPWCICVCMRVGSNCWAHPWCICVCVCVYARWEQLLGSPLCICVCMCVYARWEDCWAHPCASVYVCVYARWEQQLGSPLWIYLLKGAQQLYPTRIHTHTHKHTHKHTHTRKQIHIQNCTLTKKQEAYITLALFPAACKYLLSRLDTHTRTHTHT